MSAFEDSDFHLGVCTNCNHGDYTHSSDCGIGVERDLKYQIQNWVNELRYLMNSADSYRDFDSEGVYKVIEDMENSI